MPDSLRALTARVISLLVGALVRAAGTITIRGAGRDFVIGPRGRWSFVVLPAIGGGERTPEEIAAEEAAAAERAAAAEAEAAQARVDAERAAAETAQREEEGTATQAEVDKAYEKLRAAEAELKAQRAAAAELAARLREHEDAQLSEEQRREKEAEEGRRAGEEGRRLIREAKLLTALTARGLPGHQARAAVRLLDGSVDYDAVHEPSNLDEAIEKATGVYGATPFTPPATPELAEELPPTPRPSGAGERDTVTPPRLTAEELRTAEEAGMTPERFDALKGGASLEDWQRLNAAKQ